MSKNKFVGAVLIDLKKAFDTVDHKILLKKLWCYGFQNQSFEWFESYLTLSDAGGGAFWPPLAQIVE